MLPESVALLSALAAKSLEPAWPDQSAQRIAEIDFAIEIIRRQRLLRAPCPARSVRPASMPGKTPASSGGVSRHAAARDEDIAARAFGEFAALIAENHFVACPGAALRCRRVRANWSCGAASSRRCRLRCGESRIGPVRRIGGQIMSGRPRAALLRPGSGARATAPVRPATASSSAARAAAAVKSQAEALRRTLPSAPDGRRAGRNPWSNRRVSISSSGRRAASKKRAFSRHSAYSPALSRILHHPAADAQLAPASPANGQGTDRDIEAGRLPSGAK